MSWPDDYQMCSRNMLTFVPQVWKFNVVFQLHEFVAKPFCKQPFLLAHQVSLICETTCWTWLRPVDLMTVKCVPPILCKIHLTERHNIFGLEFWRKTKRIVVSVVKLILQGLVWNFNLVFQLHEFVSKQFSRQHFLLAHQASLFFETVGTKKFPLPGWPVEFDCNQLTWWISNVFLQHVDICSANPLQN